MKCWTFIYGIRNGHLQLMSWEKPLTPRQALKRLRKEHPIFEWRSTVEGHQSGRIHYIESRLKPTED